MRKLNCIAAGFAITAASAVSANDNQLAPAESNRVGDLLTDIPVAVDSAAGGTHLLTERTASAEIRTLAAILPDTNKRKLTGNSMRSGELASQSSSKLASSGDESKGAVSDVDFEGLTAPHNKGGGKIVAATEISRIAMPVSGEHAISATPLTDKLGEL